MKILVVDNMFSELTLNLDSAGGFERRNLTDAYLLAEAGHTVYYTYSGPKVRSRDFPFVPVWICDTLAEDAESPPKWRNKVKARLLSFLEKYPVDVILFGSNTMMSAASALVEKSPLLVHVASFLTGNGFIDSGRMSQFLSLSNKGAYFVFNTRTTHCKFLEQAQVQSQKLKSNPAFQQHLPALKHFSKAEGFADYINVHNMGVGLVGRKSGQKIRESSSNGYAVLACRADPVKMAHRFSKVDFPLIVFLKSRAVSLKNDYLKDTVKKLEANPNITVMVDEPYLSIMGYFRSAKCCIVSWPDETFGLTAFEAASYGVPSVVMLRAESDQNATVEFLSSVKPKPLTVAYSAAWLKRLSTAVSSLDDSLETRTAYASEFGEFFSKEAYVTEKETVLANAIAKHRKIHSR